MRESDLLETAMAGSALRVNGRRICIRNEIGPVARPAGHLLLVMNVCQMGRLRRILNGALDSGDPILLGQRSGSRVPVEFCSGNDDRDTGQSSQHCRQETPGSGAERQLSSEDTHDAPPAEVGRKATLIMALEDHQHPMCERSYT
jgi:hypothetical protein